MNRFGHLLLYIYAKSSDKFKIQNTEFTEKDATPMFWSTNRKHFSLQYER